MISRRLALFLVLALVGFFAVDAESTVYQLYYLGGQSNMDGYGRVEELPPEIAGPVEGVMIFHGNTSADGTPVDGRGVWAELQPGHGGGYTSDGTTVTYSDRFGIELTFARTLKELEPDTPIAIIKYSRGGTSIDRAAASYFGSWDPDYPGGTGAGINQYDHFLATIRHALSVDDIDGDGESDTLVPTGIVWMQGESDAAHTKDIALRYEAHLERLMDLIRAAFRTDDLPVVIGRISDSGQDTQENDGKVWNYGAAVRQAQEAFVTNDGRAALVTNTDGYGYSDPWHYDSAGYIDLGKRFAVAMHGLQGTPSSSTPDPDPLRFQPEIEAFATWDGKNSYMPNSVLLAGSSSMRYWPAAFSFPECPMVNRGFGGAHISDVNHFYPVVVQRYSPRVIVFYAGDNDIAAGKSPSQVFDDFKEFIAMMRRDLPKTELLYLPIKPSTSRWHLWREMVEVNTLIERYAESEGDVEYVDIATPMLGDDGTPIKELFVGDGPHLNEQGYELWTSILGPYLSPVCGDRGAD
jgi:hypothetical protein